MEIKIIDSIEKLIFYKAEWESILKGINNDILFLELDWILYWWKFFGDKHDLFVLIVLNDEEIAGICPLMITSKGICNEINFIGGTQSGRMDFILKDVYREEAVECILNFLRNLKGNNIIELHGMSVKSQNYILVREYLKAQEMVYISNNIVSYVLNLKDNDFNAHFQNRFGKDTRYKMNKKEKKLKSLGNLVYKKIAVSEINDIFDIHDKRWLRKVGNSSFSKGVTKEFYKGLVLNKNMKFNTTIDAITLNNRIISFLYGFEYNGKILLFRIAHDDDFYLLSPGELIFKKKIEESFFSQMRVLDFGPGYEPYKARWTDDYEEVFTMVLPSNNFQSNLNFNIKYWNKINLINALKKNKSIDSFRKYYLGKLKYVFSRENISGRISKIKRDVDRNGLLVFIFKCFTDLTGKIFTYKKYLILEKELTNVELSQNRMHVKEAGIDDLDRLSKAANESPSNIIRRFINKHKCYITLYDGKIIHYCWIDCSSIEISSVKLNISFEKSDVHIYGDFMEKKYKNENNYEYILSNIFNLLYKENFKKCYITLNSCNKSFENGIYKNIFHPRYEIYEKRVFSTIKRNIVDLKLSDKG